MNPAPFPLSFSIYMHTTFDATFSFSNLFVASLSCVLRFTGVAMDWEQLEEREYEAPHIPKDEINTRELFDKFPQEDSVEIYQGPQHMFKDF